MKVELLAPGGSYKTVIAAYNAGADAVYTGGEKFGARASADNLSLEELKNAIDYAHLHDKKLYLTVNTLLKENEIEKELYDYLRPLYEYGLDAVIVQDFGVVCFVKKYFPKLHIHASTQMTITGDITAKMLQESGVSRIVTPRELSLSEISAIKKGVDIEIESFVHGALCYCYSGQCLLSSYIGGRSGNRGRCAQPCRMEYDVLKNNKVINPGNNKYVLSPKDICTLNILPEIIEAGVYSLKIEGRMKKPEYTAGVISIYRKYIDLYMEQGKKNYNVDKNDIEKLKDLFNRKGFSESFYKVYNSKEMITFSKPDFRVENKEFVTYIQNKYINNNLRKSIDIYVKIEKDSNIEVVGVCGDVSVTVFGDKPDFAQKIPITKEMVVERISKLGNTNFIPEHVEAKVDDNLFVTVGTINKLKRELVEKLEEQVVSRYRRSEFVPYEKISEHRQVPEKCVSTALVSNFEQFRLINDWERISRIYLEITEFSNTEIQRAMKCKKKSVYAAMPYVFRNKDKEIFWAKHGDILQEFDGFLIRNIEEYFWLKNLDVVKNFIFDYNVYVMNHYSRDFLNEKGAEYYTVPVELNYKELLSLRCDNQEFIVYGYMPVMTSVHCVCKNCDKCNKDKPVYELRDRKSERFKVKCVCDYCYNIIFNCKPLSLLEYDNMISKLNLGSVRYSFTFENKNQILDIIESIDNNTYNTGDDTTKGHFKRGVL